MTITADMLRTWSEHLCRAAGDATETAKAFGFAGMLAEHGDYWDIMPLPTGTKQVLLVNGEGGIGHVDIEFAEPLARGEIDARFGKGELVPRIGPGRPHELAYHVVVPGTPYTCEVFVAFTAAPTTPATVAHGIILRRDRSTIDCEEVVRLSTSTVMSAEFELAELVMDHLSRGNQIDAALGAVISGLAKIGSALSDAQERRGNWGTMLADLRVGAESVRVALDRLRAGGPGLSGLVRFAERQLVFATLLQDQIIRLQANESTVV